MKSEFYIWNFFYVTIQIEWNCFTITVFNYKILKLNDIVDISADSLETVDSVERVFTDS